MKFRKERKEIVYFCKRLYYKGLTTTLGGNVSCRAGDGRILITPSSIDKNNIKPGQLVILSINGENLTPGIKPSIEKDMLLNIYKCRPEINAIIHAHPAVSSAFAVMDRVINTNLLAESRVFLKDLVKIPYFRQGSGELAKAVSHAFINTRVALMQNHGVITAGRNMTEAFERIEVLESAAKITLITNLLNNWKEIPGEELSFLDSIL